MRRMEVTFGHVKLFDEGIDHIEDRLAEEIEIRIKYEGYIKRQEVQVQKMKKLENFRLPDDIDYNLIHGLSNEVKEKLSKVKPLTLGQASRISGVTPAALMAIQVYLKKHQAN